jgi:hypothetical protein
MQIKLQVDRNMALLMPPGPIGLGWTLVFSDNLVWQSVKKRRREKRLTGPAGTHSGTNRVLRVVGDKDVYPEDVLVQEYEATFVLPAVNRRSVKLAAGQVTVRGVFLTWPDGSFAPPFKEKRFAITGGTGEYRHARGYGIEDGAVRTLEIDL